ncbi:tumor necrosis factor ligand superfamily member 13B-like [Aulostomus maculatus]
MLYNALLSLTAFMFCLSLFLVHRARVLENDFRKLQGDITLQLNQPRSEVVNGRKAKTSELSEGFKCQSSALQNTQCSPKISPQRVRREQGSCRASTSFLQLRAKTNKQPSRRGNITTIPWTVSVQQGNAISVKENRIVIQEDGYYLVFGQVLFTSPSIVMGHIIRSWGSSESGAGSTERLRCLQQMPEKSPANTCYTAGVVQLDQNEELELVIPNRPEALISTEAEWTFFGVILLN